MRTFFKHTLRTVVVLVAVTAITSISIDATDTFRTSQSALGIFASYVTKTGCAEGTASLQFGDNTLCIDVYEASVGESCPIAEPHSAVDTATNAATPECMPVSKPGVLPWRFATVVQAEELCARAGKRLLSAAEWYAAARGTADGDQVCVLTSTLQPTGSVPKCHAGSGAFDMVGNVWELVSDRVQNGVLDGVSLPNQGYVTEVSQIGVPNRTGESPSAIYNNDYFWREAGDTAAVMRGGYYGSGSDGGIYSVHTGMNQDFASAATGFRCVGMPK